MSTWWARQKEKRSTFWLGVLLVGPLALPILWRDPRYSRLSKFLISLGVILLTVYVCWHTYQVFLQTLEQLRALGVNPDESY